MVRCRLCVKRQAAVYPELRWCVVSIQALESVIIGFICCLCLIVEGLWEDLVTCKP